MSQATSAHLRQYLLQRKDPRTGFVEKLVYTGPLHAKPRGWTLVSPQ